MHQPPVRTRIYILKLFTYKHPLCLAFLEILNSGDYRKLAALYFEYLSFSLRMALLLI